MSNLYFPETKAMYKFLDFSTRKLDQAIIDHCCSSVTVSQSLAFAVEVSQNKI